jgi:Omp85 superfamily domain
MVRIQREIYDFRSLSGDKRSKSILSIGLIVLCLLFTLPAQAAERDQVSGFTVGPDSLQETPTRLSYWGSIPSPADSVTAEFRQPGRPLWEKTVLVPFWLIRAPFTALTCGIGESYIYLDESGVMYQISQLLKPRQGPFGMTLSLKAGNQDGFGGGLTLTHKAFLGGANHLKARFRFTTEGGTQLSLGTIFREEQRLQTVVGTGYRVRPHAHYCGIGPETVNVESEYKQETGWVGVTVRHLLSDWFTTDLTCIYSGISTRRAARGDDPQIEDLFPTEIPLGYGDRSEGVTTSIALRFNTSADIGRPSHGGIREFKLSRFLPTRDLKAPAHDGTTMEASAFWSARANFEQFLPLWFTNRSLILRTHITWIDPDDNSAMPFQRLLTNDDPDLLRGFNDNRWRDRGLVVGMIEYRWPIWANKDNQGLGLDAFIFTDVGQVFNDFDQISSALMTVSYGGGIRLVDEAEFLGCLEFGWSKEEFVFRLRTDKLYQYARGGLQHGRDQVALR